VPRFQRKGRLLKLRHHLALAEIAEVAAIGARARIGRLFLGDVLELLAGIEILDDGKAPLPWSSPGYGRARTSLVGGVSEICLS
jgi:hypothetical protein